MKSLRDRAQECGYRRCPRRYGRRCLKCERVEELRQARRRERQLQKIKAKEVTR